MSPLLRLLAEVGLVFGESVVEYCMHKESQTSNNRKYTGFLAQYVLGGLLVCFWFWIWMFLGIHVFSISLSQYFQNICLFKSIWCVIPSINEWSHICKYSQGEQQFSGSLEQEVSWMRNEPWGTFSGAVTVGFWWGHLPLFLFWKLPKGNRN